MKKLLICLFVVTVFGTIYSAPRISFKSLLEQAEFDAAVLKAAKREAVRQSLPVNILTSGRVMMDAKGIEDGKVVYAVFTDLADIFNGGTAAFYDEIISGYDLSHSRIDYGNGRLTDNTGGMFEPVFSSRNVNDAFVMIPEWTGDKVYLFNAQNGDLVDADFIPTTSPQLQSPRQALLHFSGRYILVSDQISDVVQKFDTNGSYTGVQAPAGGVNNSILNNVRGMTYRSNLNLLVANFEGAPNTIQQFDTGGVFINSFISTGLNSPFDILIRSTDILVTNSSGTNKITRYDLNGGFLSNYYTQSNITFPQQMYRLPNGFIAVCVFSVPGSGLAILDSAGNYIKTMTGVTGLRGVYLLGNGHYLTTNASGVHEIDSANGSLIRTISTAANFQFISPYNPGALLSSGNNGNVIPDEFMLEQNYPNPFNPSTNIKYHLPKSGIVKISVFDINGREAAVLVNEYKSAGSYDVSFNASGLSSGAYFYKLESGGFSEYKKMVLVK